MKNLVLVNGSPRASGSTSLFLLSKLRDRLGAGFRTATVEACKAALNGKQPESYREMAEADAIVIAFPLYIYCLPGMLMEFLDGYRRFLPENGKPAGQKVYAVVNCGFPESRICAEAARVIRRFCETVGAEYRFGILIGGGGMLVPAEKAPFMKKTWNALSSAFDAVAGDLRSGGETAEIRIDAAVPKRLYYWAATASFSGDAKKNGLTKKDLFRRPYRPEETE